MQFLETWQHSLGLPGFTGLTLGVGVVFGLLVSRFTHGRSSSVPHEPTDNPIDLELSTATLDSTKTPREQRRTPRRSGRHVHVFVSVPDSNSEPCQGIVLDRSIGGLKLLLRDEYKPGATLSVLPGEASELTPWVRVGVKTCRKSGDDWEVGVQFHSAPPYATLVLFG